MPRPADQKHLQPNDIHLWITQPQQAKDSLLLQHYDTLMTSEERARQQRYKFPKHQHEALVTRAFVRSVLSHYEERDPKEWRFVKGEKDKPEIVDPHLPLRFNLSHTENLIICAVCLNHDLGADVEFIDRKTDVLAIADRYFSPVEVAELFSLPDEKTKRSRFFDYWTLKESYIKAWGLGLSIPLDHFSFHIDEAAQSKAPINDRINLSFIPERNDNPADWQSWLFYPNETHRMAMSIRGGDGDFNLRFFKGVPLMGFDEISLPL